jgi:nucleotide-binding universal stress UspA family protein
MKMIRSILVPLDGSSFAEHALPLALGLARRHDAAVHLAMVHVPITTAYIDGVAHFDPSLDNEIRERERRYLDAVAERLEGSGIAATTALLDGPVVGMLEAEARERHADVIVMSTHGRGGLSRAWLGSVADALVRRAPAPVLLVRPKEGEEAALEAVTAFRRILVPLDGSALAEEAIGYALAVGDRASTRYTLLRVVIPALVVGSPFIEPGVHIADEDLEEQMEAARRYLDRVAERLRRDGADVDTVVVAHPSPAAAILELADSEGADLVCLATHGRTGLSRILLGSVADKVLRAATTPVLLCRSAH